MHIEHVCIIMDIAYYQLAYSCKEHSYSYIHRQYTSPFLHVTFRSVRDQSVINNIKTAAMMFVVVLVVHVEE